MGSFLVQHNVEARFSAVTEELTRITKTAQQYHKLKSQFDLKMHEVELFAARVAQSTHHQMLAELQALETGLVASKEVLKAAGEKEAAAIKAAKEIELAMKNNVSEVRDANVGIASLLMLI